MGWATWRSGALAGAVSFVIVMALGGALAMAGLRVPYTEEGILLSVLVLGILVAVAARFPLPACMAIVGIFAFFHGHSHGMEMPANAVGYAYGAGFILATVLLHAVGIGLAYAMQTVKQPVVRWAARRLPWRGFVFGCFSRRISAATSCLNCGVCMLASINAAAYQPRSLVSCFPSPK